MKSQTIPPFSKPFKDFRSVNQAEFLVAFRTIEPLLKRRAFELTNDLQQAQDLFQETSCIAFECSKHLKPHFNFHSWMLKIMNKVARGEDCNCYLLANQSKAYSPFTSINNVDLSDALELSNTDYNNVYLLSKFSPVQRRTYYYYQSGKKYFEIAQKLKLPLSKVKAYVHTVRQELRLHQYQESIKPLS